MKDTKNKETRARNWTIVLYPESAPDDWRSYMDDLHIEWIESPLHDKDISANGEIKKEHWHILLMYGSLKSYEQVKETIEYLNCPSPQKCHNAKAMVRYMAHLDNPEKAQYDQTKIIPHGGVDIAELLRPSTSERYTLIKEMIEFIKDNELKEFQDIVDYAAEHRYDDWFPMLIDNSTIFITNYIKSIRHRTKKVTEKKDNRILDK